MRKLPDPTAVLLAVLFAGALAPVPARGQSREVISKEIAVGGNEASLHLGFSGEGTLDVRFLDGAVLIDGDRVGDYRPGDALDATWRTLLGEVLSLEDGPLTEHLRTWAPPAPPSLTGASAGVARRIDAAFEAALSERQGSPGLPAPLGTDAGRTLTALLGRPRRLLEVARALEDAELDDLDLDALRVHVGESVTVAAGDRVTGTLVVIDGDLALRGEVDGDVMVVGGSLRVADGGRVTGDARLVDARLLRDGGEIEGRVIEVPADLGAEPPAMERDRSYQIERLRAQLRDEIRGELDSETRADRNGGGGLLSPLRAVGHGLAGIASTLVTILLVGGIGGGLAVHFARDRLEVVAEEARRAPLRAAMVGLAGTFLTLPAWILGAIALVVTVVGILAVPFWIVLFPLAVGLAAAVGYLAVAQGVGDWVARQRYPRLTWVRMSNPYSTAVAGVGALMLAFLAAHAIEMVGFLGALSNLLLALGAMVTVAAAMVGFGAVLLTRGGRPTEWAGVGGADWDDPWDGGPFGGSAPRGGGPGPAGPEAAGPGPSGPGPDSHPGRSEARAWDSQEGDAARPETDPGGARPPRDADEDGHA